MNRQRLTSWGRVHCTEQNIHVLTSRFNLLPELVSESQNYLAYGNGRSYGDSCLNEEGLALKTQRLDRFIAFDSVTGVLRCEAGVLLAEILKLVVPKGWFLPVTPGTKFVTVGGAIANDVHGKNHHVMGTLGCHIKQFELIRSDGQRLTCSAFENPYYYAATIGGLGLTGLIVWAEMQLCRISNVWIDEESRCYQSVDAFFDLCLESDQDYEYTVSWVDCSGTGKRLGRGLFIRGNHATADRMPDNYHSKSRKLAFHPPISLINPLTLKAFNTVYYYKQIATHAYQTKHYESFFYPLDRILEWNRIYGPSGFYQYQCVIPLQEGKEAVTALLNIIAKSGMGSFLAVLKLCGDIQSPGMLSFPMRGVSLALDFPNQGNKTLQLFKRLDTIVTLNNGRLYPAKDGRMSGELFRQGYPNWQIFSQYVDPKFSSSFWRRVIGNT